MKKEILFIHGAGEGAYDEDKKLVENLRQLLGVSYEIRYPKMENEEDAPYKVWTSQIKSELATMKGALILIGHSLGGSVLLKFLAEEKTGHAIAGIFIVAAPFWGGDGWTYDGYETLMLPEQTESSVLHDVPVFLYHSDDDEVVPFKHLSLYSRKFPRAQVRKIKNRGHQMDNNLPEVANDIRQLA
jgi:uncharacterized protein